MSDQLRFLIVSGIAFDAALLAGLCLYLTWSHLVSKHEVLRGYVSVGTLLGALGLLMVQDVATVLWDLWHQANQSSSPFPLTVRLGFTLPALYLANYSLWKQVVWSWRKWD